MCIRHEVSADAQNSAFVSSTHRSLSPNMAIDVSAFLTANVPPNPQHSVSARQLDQVDPTHGAEKLQWGIADPNHAERMAGRVVGHPVGVVSPDILDAQLVDQKLGELEDPRGELAHGLSQLVVFRQLGCSGIEVAHHPHARRGGGDDHLGIGEHLGEPPDQGNRLALISGIECICPQQVCSSGKSTVCPSRSSSETTARPVWGNNVSLKQVMNRETRIAHTAPVLRPCVQNRRVTLTKVRVRSRQRAAKPPSLVPLGHLRQPASFCPEDPGGPGPLAG